MAAGVSRPSSLTTENDLGSNNGFPAQCLKDSHGQDSQCNTALQQFCKQSQNTSSHASMSVSQHEKSQQRLQLGLTHLGVVQSKLRGRLRKQRSLSHMQQKKRQRQSGWQTKLSGEPCRNRTRGIWPQLWLHPPQQPGDLTADTSSQCRNVFLLSLRRL